MESKVDWSAVSDEELDEEHARRTKIKKDEAVNLYIEKMRAREKMIELQFITAVKDIVPGITDEQIEALKEPYETYFNEW